jgi:hypothetical protein
MTNGPSGDEALWQDLVARLEQPVPANLDAVPWPDRENLRHAATDTAQHTGDDQTRIIRPAGLGPGPAQLFPPPPDAADAAEPAGPPAAELSALPGAAAGDADAGDSDHRYVAPPAPPLPRLSPVTKAAWVALFGGPGYLFAATLLGWQVPGWAALAAIAAFVAGFTLLVIRLGDGPSRRDDPDHGAVV